MNNDIALITDDHKVAEAVRFAGVRIESVYDLVNSQQKYSSAIPILSRLLHEVQRPRIKEGIARALTVKEARGVASELVREFREMPAETGPEMSAKWAIANALAVTGTDDLVDDVISLMEDQRHGWTRSMLPLALVRAKNMRAAAVNALLRSFSDDQLACAAADALAKLKVADAIEPLQLLGRHNNKDIQKAAASALKRLQRR